MFPFPRFPPPSPPPLSASHKLLSRSPFSRARETFFLRSSFSPFSFSSRSFFRPSISLSLARFPASSSRMLLFFLFVFRMLLRAAATAENTTTDQLCPEDVEREELTIRQFKSTVPIPTVTSIIIFHMMPTTGEDRRERGGGGGGPRYTRAEATGLDYEINLGRCGACSRTHCKDTSSVGQNK